MRIATAILASLALANVAAAQPTPPPPPALPPTLKIVADVDKAKGNIVFVETVTRHVTVTKEIVVIENGVAVKKAVTEYVPVMEMRMVAFPVKDNRFITAGGKKIAPEDVVNRVKKDSAVAVSADTNAPAAAYLRALNAETVVIIPTRARNDFLPPPPPPPLPPPAK